MFWTASRMLCGTSGLAGRPSGSIFTICCMSWISGSLTPMTLILWNRPCTTHICRIYPFTPQAHLDRRQIDDYFYTIKAKLSLYLTSLHDEDLLQRPRKLYLDPLHLDFGTVPALAPAFGDADGFCTGGHRFVPPYVTTEH